MRRPLISILIVNYNQKGYTKACLESLNQITYKNIEIIVVDNNSTDGSREMLKKFKNSKFPARGGQAKLQIIENGENLGFAGGNNAGYKRARGEYVLLLNNDTKVTPGFLEPLVEDMQKDKKLGIVQSKMYVMDRPRYLDSVASYLTFTGYLYHEGYLAKDVGQFDELKYALSVKGACMLVRKSALKLGLFDEDYFAYFEETDLCWRTWLLGYKVAFEPKSVIYHKMGATSGKMNNWFIQFHSFKNRIRTILKNVSLGTLVWMMPVHLFVSLGFMCYLLVTGRFGGVASIVRAVVWNVSNISDTLRKRKKVQSLRKLDDREVFKYTLNNPSIGFYRRHLGLLMKGVK